MSSGQCSTGRPRDLPLYTEARHAGPELAVADGIIKGHAGLWWDKFFDLWSQDWGLRSGKESEASKQDCGNPKLSWLLSLLHSGRPAAVGSVSSSLSASLSLGEQNSLDEAQSRRQQLFQAIYAQPIELKLKAPFVTGLGLDHPTENGFLFHHTLAVPYIPASSLKGLTRAYAEQWEQVGAEEVARIFGPRAEGQGLTVGSVIFFDALPLEPVRLTVEIMTPHYQPWYQAQNPAEHPPADWYDPVPIPFLAVAPGARFRSAVAPRRGSDKSERADAARALDWLTRALALLGAGAKTAVGFGRFERSGERAKREADLPRQARAAAVIRPQAPAGPAPAAGTTGNVAERALGPVRDFPIGIRVEYADSEGVVVGYEGDRLVVDFNGEWEPVDPRSVRRIG